MSSEWYSAFVTIARRSAGRLRLYDRRERRGTTGSAGLSIDKLEGFGPRRKEALLPASRRGQSQLNRNVSEPPGSETASGEGCGDASVEQHKEDVGVFSEGCFGAHSAIGPERKKAVQNEVSLCSRLHPTSFLETEIASVADHDVIENVDAGELPVDQTSCRSRSSGDGDGSPNGWLWHTMIAAALARIAALNTSRGWTSVESSVPRLTS